MNKIVYIALVAGCIVTAAQADLGDFVGDVVNTGANVAGGAVDVAATAVDDTGRAVTGRPVARYHHVPGEVVEYKKTTVEYLPEDHIDQEPLLLLDEEPLVQVERTQVIEEE